MREPTIYGRTEGDLASASVVSAADQRLLEALFPNLISSLKDLGYAQDREVFRDSILKLRTQKLRPPVQRRYVYQTFLTLNHSNSITCSVALVVMTSP